VKDNQNNQHIYFHKLRTKFYLFSHKKLRIPKSLVCGTYFIKYQQSIVQ